MPEVETETERRLEPQLSRLESPASKGIRVLVAAAFVAIWLAIEIYDILVVPGETTVPVWFQVSGLIVLGYLLGISLDDVAGGVRGRK